jgi:AAA family ATP:ADP antiporter
MSRKIDNQFGKLRSTLWPIHTYELKKIIPMLIMAFGVSFNYSVLRDTKDTIVVSTIDELALPFLKLFGTLPVAIIFVLTFSKLANMLKRETLFYTIITPFILFFIFFAAFLYPNQEMLQPTALVNWLFAVLPEGFYSAIQCLQYWPLALFYIAAELWGSAMLNLLFWQFANEIVKTAEARRFYTIFSLAINSALLFSGGLIYQVSKYGKTVALTGGNPWQYSLNMLMSIVVCSGLVVIFTYWWMNRNVLTDKRFYDPEKCQRVKKSNKPKMGVFESMSYLFRSRYLLCIAMLVIGYGMCINLVEVVWKGQLKLQYPNENDYSAFMGLFSMCLGIFATTMTLFGGYFIRKLSWAKVANFTPMALLTTGVLFFVFIIFRDYLAGALAILGTTPLMMAVMLGMVQNIASKSTKYSFFDPTKEMAYIPLDNESKVKGKAAIDVVGSRLGKSGSAFVWNVLAFTLVSAFGRDIGKAIATPIVAVLMVVVIFAWLAAVKSLSVQYSELTGEKEAEEEAEQQSLASSKKAIPATAV